MLRYGLGVLLAFIGMKMILHELFHVQITTTVSLMVILGILLSSVILSWLIPQKK